MKTADETIEALRETSMQPTDPIAAAVGAKKKRLMTDPAGRWCSELLARDSTARLAGAPGAGGIMRDVPLVLGMSVECSGLRLSGVTADRLSLLQVPTLDRIRVAVAGSLPAIGGTRATPHEAPVKSEPMSPARPLKKPSLPPTRPFIPATVPVKVLPTREKRVRREQPIEIAPAVEVVPKPLKVIRRRKEAEPKVFETPPKIVPKAMLEGVSASTGESREGE